MAMGKGLGALISDTGVAQENPTVVELKIIEVEPNKNQPRTNFDDEKLEDLAASIREHGVISPILVKKQSNGFYKIIAGERRWRASKKAGKKTIPAIIKDFTNQQVQEIALIENLQREDLNPIEEARGYKQLMEDFELTQEQISQKVSKSRSTVANSLRLLNLSTKICGYLEQNKLSAAHAKILLRCPRLSEIPEAVVSTKAFVRSTRRFRQYLCISSAPRYRFQRFRAFLSCGFEFQTVCRWDL